MTEKIPRRIIQTAKSADLPLLAKAAMTNLRLLNPNFEYLFFDDAQVEEFIDAEFPRYREIGAYNRHCFRHRSLRESRPTRRESHQRLFAKIS